MISALVVKCKNCGTYDSFTSSTRTPTVRTLAERAGWRETVRGWICERCKREELCTNTQASADSATD